MLRRGRVRNEQELLRLSLEQGIAESGPAGPALAARYRQSRTEHERFIVEDEGSGVNWNVHNRPIARGKGDPIFQRGMKRTLALDHFETRGFYGPYPVELYSTSPWHAYLVSRFLRSSYPAFLPFLALETIRIYHEPFQPYSDAANEGGESRIALLDLRELRGLLMGSHSEEDLFHTIRSLANFHLPRHGFLVLNATATVRPDGTRASLSFGHAPAALSAGRILLASEETLWTPEGTAAAHREAFPSRGLARAPSTVIFFCSDQTGGLPLAARLNSKQARFFFETGYRPNPTSAHDHCYGASQHPRACAFYGQAFERRLADQDTEAWIVNTGRTSHGPVPPSLVRAVAEAIEEGLVQAPEPEIGEANTNLRPPTFLPEVSDAWLRAPGAEEKAALARELA